MKSRMLYLHENIHNAGQIIENKINISNTTTGKPVHMLTTGIKLREQCY
jgi:hypothetical protein